MTQEQLHLILRKYRQGLGTPEEERIINDWYNSVGTDSDINLTSLEEEILENRYWYNLDNHIQKSKISNRPIAKLVKLSSWRNLSAAAAVLIGVVSFAYLVSTSKSDTSKISSTSSNTLLVGQNEIINKGLLPQAINLSDGSRIVLQPGSKVSFFEPFNSTQRELYLEGEAFFEVAKDPAHPFLVFTNEVTTKVLGTSFLVRAKRDEKEIVVTVKTGKVMVYAQSLENKGGVLKNLQEVILKPNQQIIYNRETENVATKLIEKPEIVLAEPTFKMNYNNAPVADILEALEESYGVDIQFDKDALSACTLTTDLTEEGLYERIEIICNALGATYTSIDTAIVIEAKSCN